MSSLDVNNSLYSTSYMNSQSSYGQDNTHFGHFLLVYLGLLQLNFSWAHILPLPSMLPTTDKCTHTQNTHIQTHTSLKNSNSMGNVPVHILHRYNICYFFLTRCLENTNWFTHISQNFFKRHTKKPKLWAWCHCELWHIQKSTWFYKREYVLILRLTWLEEMRVCH